MNFEKDEKIAVQTKLKAVETQLENALCEIEEYEKNKMKLEKVLNSPSFLPKFFSRHVKSPLICL